MRTELIEAIEQILKGFDIIKIEKAIEACKEKIEQESEMIKRLEDDKQKLEAKIKELCTENCADLVIASEPCMLMYASTFVREILRLLKGQISVPPIPQDLTKYSDLADEVARKVISFEALPIREGGLTLLVILIPLCRSRYVVVALHKGLIQDKNSVTLKDIPSLIATSDEIIVIRPRKKIEEALSELSERLPQDVLDELIRLIFKLRKKKTSFSKAVEDIRANIESIQALLVNYNHKLESKLNSLSESYAIVAICEEFLRNSERAREALIRSFNEFIKERIGLNTPVVEALVYELLRERYEPEPNDTLALSTLKLIDALREVIEKGLIEPYARLDDIQMKGEKKCREIMEWAKDKGITKLTIKVGGKEGLKVLPCIDLYSHVFFASSKFANLVSRLIERLPEEGTVVEARVTPMLYSIFYYSVGPLKGRSTLKPYIKALKEARKREIITDDEYEELLNFVIEKVPRVAIYLGREKLEKVSIARKKKLAIDEKRVISSTIDDIVIEVSGVISKSLDAIKIELFFANGENEVVWFVPRKTIHELTNILNELTS